MKRTTKSISVDELYNNYLDNILDASDKAMTLIRVISEHFEASAKALQKDNLLKNRFIIDYPEIQTEISILMDYVFAINEKMETIMTVDVLNKGLKEEQQK